MRFEQFRQCERGASLLEYSLLVGLISLTIVSSIALITGSLAISWSAVASIMGQVASA